jgi:predicted transcriptional regulator
MKLKKPTNKLTAKEIKNLVESDNSKSSKMRDLFDSGLEIKEISVQLDVRYNFVYNVVSRYILKKQISEDQIIKESNSGSNLKDQVKEILNENPDIKVSEIAKQLNKNYNYIWKLHNELTNK